MEEYLEQFQPRPLAPEKKAFLLGPALELLKEQQTLQSNPSLFWNRIWKITIAASLLFLVGFHAYVANWNQKIMQRYGQEVTKVHHHSLENAISEAERDGIQHYFLFQKLSQQQQKTKNIVHYYQSLNKF